MVKFLALTLLVPLFTLNANPIRMKALRLGNPMNEDISTYESSDYKISPDQKTIERHDEQFSITSAFVLKGAQMGKEVIAPYPGQEEVRFFPPGLEYDLDDLRFGPTNLAVWLGRSMEEIQKLGYLKTKKMGIKVYSQCKDMLNAFFDPSRNIICIGHLYETLGREQLGGMASLSWDADVIVHEFGHGVFQHLNNLGKRTFFSFGNDTFGSMNEGQADFLSHVITGTESLAPWMIQMAKAYYKKKVPQVYERMKNKKSLREINNDFNLRKNFFGEIHSDGAIFAGALFDLGKAVGRKVALKLWLEAVTRSQYTNNFYDYIQLILDADNDIYRGVHRSQIREVFYNRGFLGNEDPTDANLNVETILVDDPKILTDVLKKLGVNPMAIGSILKNNNPNGILDREECAAVEFKFHNRDFRNFVGLEAFLPANFFSKGLKNMVQNRFSIGNLKSGQSFPQSVNIQNKRRPWIFICSGKEMETPQFTLFLKASSKGSKKIQVTLNN